MLDNRMYLGLAFKLLPFATVFMMQNANII
jgi:hypothetical protein